MTPSSSGFPTSTATQPTSQSPRWLYSPQKVQYAVMTQVGVSALWRTDPFLYDDYFEAVVWAMMLFERVTDIRRVRVVILDQVNDAEMPRASNPKLGDDAL